MPIPDFNGSTFVAYTDISGFKEMMRRGDRAVQAIDRFYSEGYRTLQEQPMVHGFFVSDCGILFSRNSDLQIGYEAILRVIEQLNRALLPMEIMLTTSICYGPFSYHNRLEFPGIEKNPIYGNAYLRAFLDNEGGTPKIQPGECRIIAGDLPEAVTNPSRVISGQKHHLFYWMVNEPSKIEAFKSNYDDAYQQKYRGMLSALRTATR